MKIILLLYFDFPTKLGGETAGVNGFGCEMSCYCLHDCYIESETGKTSQKLIVCAFSFAVGTNGMAMRSKDYFQSRTIVAYQCLAAALQFAACFANNW